MTLLWALESEDAYAGGRGQPHGELGLSKTEHPATNLE